MENAHLNAICPYFTMFPLEFPYKILRRYASAGELILDPFCGRGTTNYAGRILGLPSIGIDSSPVAVALTQAKLANTTPRSIVRTAKQILDEVNTPHDIPTGEFWERAFQEDVLYIICRLRDGLLRNCHSDSRKALRAIILGALHGPIVKSSPSYFSNQSPRTYAPKPNYAIKYWKNNDLIPPKADVLQIVENRAKRYYSAESKVVFGKVIHGDNRTEKVYSLIKAENKVNWIITSPPYYGMRTYMPDQWLRMWFLGGEPRVNYSAEGQIEHSSPETFSLQLGKVWKNVSTICMPGAKLIVRFGGINDRKADPLLLLKKSLIGTGWKIKTINPAGSASEGRRQALHFSRVSKNALQEYDLWATLM